MRFLVIGMAIVIGSAAQTQPVPEARLKAAIEKSLPLLQSTDATFVKRSQCVSCHHNSLTALTVVAAREAGISVNEDVASQQVKAAAAYAESWRERLLQGTPIPGGADAVSYLLVGLGTEKHSSDAASDAMAAYLREQQSPEGRWRIQARRPPIEASDFTVTATSMRALQLYAPKSNGSAYEGSIQSALNWLILSRPTNTEERVFRLLAFGWGGASREMIDIAAQELTMEQRFDGGWSQLLHNPSDAYATGQALVALQEAAGLPASHRSIQRGIQFLLETQLEDGSWLVKTRSTPIQPYIESGFPHGKDQWISAAATNWATKALILALKRR
jgi:hypothetical protein